MNLSLEFVNGYAGQNVVSLGAGEYAYPCGVGVAFSNVQSGNVLYWTPGDATHKISRLCTNFRQTLLCVAEQRPKASVLVFSLPDRKPLQRLTDIVKLQIADMAFSRDGSLFAVQADAPQFSLSIYAVDPTTKRFNLLCQQAQHYTHQFTFLSFNPRNGNELCTSGGGHLTMWKFERQPPSLTPIEGKVTTRNVRLTNHTWLPLGTLVAGTYHGCLFSFDSHGLGTLAVDTGSTIAITSIVVTKHHIVAATEDGQLHFCDHDLSCVKKVISLGNAQVSALCITPEWNSLLVGDRNGKLFQVILPGYDTANAAANFVDAKYGLSIVQQGTSGAGIGVVPLDSTKTAILSSSGQLRFFEWTKNQDLAYVHVGSTPTCMDIGKGRSSHLILVGSSSGTVRVVNCSDVARRVPTISFRAKLSDSPIICAKFDSTGKNAVVATSDNVVFLSFETVPDVIAITKIPLGGIVDVCWFSSDPAVVLVAQKTAEISLVSCPSPDVVDPNTLLVEYEEVYVNGWRLDLPATRICVPVIFDESFHLFAASMDKETKVYIVDRTLAADRKERDTKPISRQTSFKDHEKQMTELTMFRGKILVTSAADGRITFRDVSNLLVKGASFTRDTKKEVVSHHNRHLPHVGGLSSFCFASEQGPLITVGYDGLMTVNSLGKSEPREIPPFAAAEALITEDNEEQMMYAIKRGDAVLEMDRKQHEGHRTAVKEGILRLREQLKHIREENDKCTDEERVALEQFLIESEREKFEQECDESISQMRDRVRWENVNREYVADVIKRDNWDVMQKKLTPLEGMKNPQQLVVYNMHTIQPEKKDLLLLRKLKFLRRVEDVDRKIRGVSELENLRAAKEEVAEGEAAKELQTIPLFEPPEGQKPRSVEEEAADDVTPFLYKPLHVFTRNRSIIQIQLLYGRTTNLRYTFNKDFSELQSRKKEDIGRIEERNHRCKQVIKELDETHDLFMPRISKREKPESILTVEDSEVSADKGTDPDEKKRLLELDAEKERWRLRHGDDDSSERALKVWMDGRLEKEDRVLVVDIEKPEFADEESEKFIPTEERTDDQNKIFREYEKKLAKRIEEVATRRRMLQDELMNIKKDNNITGTEFDGALQKLLLKRLSTAQKCYEVELQQIKILQGIALAELRRRIARKMEQQRNALADKLVKASKATEAIRAQLQTRRDMMAQLQNDEKARTKPANLRTHTPFLEGDEFGDILFKIYMKRKIKKDRVLKDKKKKVAAEDHPSMDPFAFIEKEEETKKAAELAEATQPLPRIERPENVPDSVWDEFQRFRQERVDAERDMRKLQEEISELEIEEGRLLQVESEIREVAEESIRQTFEFHRESLRDQYDIDELYMFRQGQVEVEQEPVITEYDDAILIDTHRIERLNTLIKESGAEQVKIMREIAEQRKGIRDIEWEIEHMVYCTNTLEMEYRHLHTLRVTKQMQEFINGGGEDHNERQRQKLLQKIEHVQQSMTSKIEDKKFQMQKLRRLTKEKDMENTLLLEQVSEAKCVVEDRQAIHNLQSSELEKERNQRLMHDMRVTRKLEDVAKAQQEEMVALKKEIDRLRERTFPSFAVVSKRVVGNPDEA